MYTYSVLYCQCAHHCEAAMQLFQQNTVLFYNSNESSATKMHCEFITDYFESVKSCLLSLCAYTFVAVFRSILFLHDSERCTTPTLKERIK